MFSPRYTAGGIGIALAAACWFAPPATAAPVRYAGSPGELTINIVARRMAQIVVAPLSLPQRAAPSTALVPLDARAVLMRRQLDVAATVAVGDLRLEVKLDPLTISITASRKLVQELVIDDASGTGELSHRRAGPLYVRAGAIIPLDPVRQYTSETIREPTAIRVYPGADGAFTLYDDDGRTLGYRDGSDGEIVWIHFRWHDASRRLTIEPDKRMKAWPVGLRVFSVQAVGSDAPPKQLEFRGESISINL
jgi:hypothetical protein